MSGSASVDLGRDPDVGQAVVEEVHVVEHVLDRLGAVDVDPQLRGTRRQLLGELRGVEVMRFLRLRGGSSARRGVVVRPAARHVVADLVEMSLRARDDRFGIARARSRRGSGRGGRPTTAGRRRGPTRVMYVRENGSSERQTRSSVPLSASSTIRPWNRASASATPWPSPRARGRPHRLEVAGELGDVRVGHARDREPAAERLEGRTDGVRLDDLALRRPADPGATERRDLDHAERLEPAQRLADRRLAGAELAGDLRFDDPRVRRVVAVRGCPRGAGP